MSVVDITQKLISFPSVTPDDRGAQAYLAGVLKDMGFTIYDLPYGGDNGEARIQNFFARLGTGGPHLCYAGHTDVVPVGAEDQWRVPPFSGKIVDDAVYGRGASDMKGSIAAFVAAVQTYLDQNGAPENGSISLLITGDEEADAINGTVKVLEWMEQNGHIPDVCIVGEPTNPDHVGQEVKIGRRGSVTGTLRVNGKQGHVAYQHLADNPMPRLVGLLDALASHHFDDGTDYFTPTNLEITTIDVGNTASNVIPESGTAMFNIRYNDHWTAQSIAAKIKEILDQTGYDYTLSLKDGAESFMTQPGEWTGLMVDAVTEVTGQKPEMTTNGGTSDARFVAPYCPVVEFGGVNATIHQVNEHAKIKDLEIVRDVFGNVLQRYFAAQTPGL